MSNVRFGLLFLGRANENKINDNNFPINRALRCKHYNKYDDSLRNLKPEKFIKF